ncbi:MAG: dehydrogenase [FCB group bacterium]|nr:dehydrogenase [FCB group bacterium]
MNPEQLNTPWRILSTAIYKPPLDGRTHGTMEIDVTAAEAYIKEQRSAGKRITMTHLFTTALARTIAFHVPEMNAYVRRGRLVPHQDVVVMIAVNAGGGTEMTSIKIRKAHQKTVFEIAEEIRKKAHKVRQGTENKVMQNKNILVRIPWPFRNFVVSALRFITIGLGLELRAFGFTHDAFGSILLTNIGSHGLSTGMAALFPGSNLPAVIIMGKAEEKPVVREGKIVVRKILPVSGTFDHRIVDGYHGGKLAAALIDFLQKPTALGKAHALKEA